MIPVTKSLTALISTKPGAIHFHQTRTHHSHFNPECYTNMRLQSLRTRFALNSETLSLNDLRIAGLHLQISFYDSHRFDKSIKYNQSEQKTTLLLPAGHKNIGHCGSVIGELVKGGHRVLALEFPGTGKSCLLENDLIYTGDMLQKTSIVQDFLTARLPFRKK